MEQESEEGSKEHMESDPDYESGENTTFPKIENTLGRTQEVTPSQEDTTPPPVVSDVLGSLAKKLHQLSAATGLSREVAISTKRPGLKDRKIKYHQDNVRPHTAQQI
ncbi:hypothetical protein LAZ67_11001987 [Cordylochernes scorpioides]|uniref:Uncharacterized protein n=1 Tax=Cordylochernes scorpioides TaxID=51811 RepID=A0ABY6KYU4_9ARAC|nr:hypothetical protein LAZ67_11001987 [Cordylochernes scorpioides]